MHDCMQFLPLLQYEQNSCGSGHTSSVIDREHVYTVYLMQVYITFLAEKRHWVTLCCVACHTARHYSHAYYRLPACKQTVHLMYNVITRLSAYRMHHVYRITKNFRDKKFHVRRDYVRETFFREKLLLLRDSRKLFVAKFFSYTV